MTTVPHPASGPTTRSTPSRNRWQQVLLSCGLVSSVLWPLTAETLAALLYDDYDSRSQTVSELSAIGAPTRALLTVEGALSCALLVAFGIGVWRAAMGNRPLRVTGALLFTYGAMGPLWYPFPISARADIVPNTPMGLTDVMHIVLGAADTVLMLSMLGFGAMALGRRFRVYSLLTLATVVGFGALTFGSIPQVAAAEPTPWLGVIERIYLGAFLLWVAVLSVALLRSSTSQGPMRGGDGGDGE